MRLRIRAGAGCSQPRGTVLDRRRVVRTRNSAYRVLDGGADRQLNTTLALDLPGRSGPADRVSNNVLSALSRLGAYFRLECAVAWLRFDRRCSGERLDGYTTGSRANRPRDSLAGWHNYMGAVAAGNPLLEHPPRGLCADRRLLRKPVDHRRSAVPHRGKLSPCASRRRCSA